MKSTNSSEINLSKGNPIHFNQTKKENFLNKKRKIIIISQSSDDESESSSSKSKSLIEKEFSDKNIEDNSTEKIFENNNYKSRKSININSNDTELITGMFKPNIKKVNRVNLKSNKKSKINIKEKNKKFNELKVKNNFDLENLFEKNFEFYKKNNMNFPKKNESKSNFDISLINKSRHLNYNFINAADNINNNLIYTNIVNSRNINFKNSKQNLIINKQFIKDETEKNFNDNFQELIDAELYNINNFNNQESLKYGSKEKSRFPDSMKKRINNNNEDEKEYMILNKSNCSKANGSNFSGLKKTIKQTSLTEMKKNYNNDADNMNFYSANETYITNYLEFESLFEQLYIYDDISSDFENIKSDLKIIIQNLPQSENLKESEEEKSNEEKNERKGLKFFSHNSNFKLSKKNHVQDYANSLRKKSNEFKLRFNIDEFISYFFENKKKLSKVELKRKYINLKNVIKFNTRTDKTIDIKKLTKINIDREKIEYLSNDNPDSYNDLSKCYKEEKDYKNELIYSQKNSLFSVNNTFKNNKFSDSRLTEENKNINNITNYYNKLYKNNVFENDSDFSDKDIQNEFSANINKYKEIIQATEEIREKDMKEEKFCNGIHEKNKAHEFKFGENPLKIFSDIYENSKIFYKKNLYNNEVSNKNEIIKATSKIILDVLECGEKIKCLPKIIFDFKNFDKNTFSVRDRSAYSFNNFFCNNNIVINNNSAKFFKNCNLEFEPYSNVNLNFSHSFTESKNNFVNNSNYNKLNFSYDSEDIMKKDKNNICYNLNITSNSDSNAIINNNNHMDRAYVCDICNEVFSNGQGLGGHMSRKHPNQSVKYKFKKETREKRNLKREIIYEAKRRILKKYHQNYDDMINSNEGRKLIKRICKDNKDEYYKIKKEIKMQFK